MVNYSHSYENYNTYYTVVQYGLHKCFQDKDTIYLTSFNN